MNKYMLLVASAVLAVGAAQAADHQLPDWKQSLQCTPTVGMLAGNDIVSESTPGLQQTNEGGIVAPMAPSLHDAAIPGGNNNQVNNNQHDFKVLAVGPDHGHANNNNADSSSEDENGGAQHNQGERPSCCKLM